MDVLAFVLYAIVAFFAIGTILSGFFQVRDSRQSWYPAHG